MKTLIALLLGLSTIAQGQKNYPESKFNNFYFFAEVGPSTEYDFSIYGGTSLQLDRNYFKIKVGGETDRLTKAQRILAENYYGDKKVDLDTRGISSFGLIYGRSYNFLKICQLQMGTGLSYVEKADRDEVFNREKRAVEPEQYIKKRTFGLPAEIKTSFHYKRHLALNCTYNANFNPIKSTKGFTFGLALGIF